MAVTPTTLAQLVPAASENALWAGSGVLTADGALSTYVELNELTAAVANALAQLGVRRHDRVAVLCPKSIESFIAMHAILQAGAVAVPLDPFGAEHALRAVLDTTEPAAIIGDASTMVRLISGYLADVAVKVMALGATDGLEHLGLSEERMISYADAVGAARDRSSLPVVDSEDPAYIIFTSGSTGVPKGIVHTHRSGLAYAQQAVTHHGLDSGSRLAGTTALHFDMSTLELYAVPLAGATAVTITEAEQRFPATLSAHLERDGVTHLYAVPFLLRQLTERGVLGSRDLRLLTHVAYGGELYPPAAIAELRSYLNDPQMLNVYGPAELNAVTTFAFTGIDPDQEAVPIGTPWADVYVRIVDDLGADVPFGATGELLVSAPTCMQGYWHQPELTAAQFTSLPGRTPLYGTGDLAYQLHDGNLIFVGRKDHQVKIRGSRVELEATEAVLGGAPGIAQAVAGVLADAGGANELVAWVVVEPDAVLDQRELRGWCRTRLPAPAIPSRVFEIQNVPRAASGKVDRRELAKRATSHGELKE